MFEALERLHDAKASIDVDAPFERPVIKTVNDIRAVIKRLSSVHSVPPTKITAAVESSDDSGRTITHNVTSLSRTTCELETLREMMERTRPVIEPADVTPVTVNGRPMSPPTVTGQVKYDALDELISRTLGGYRSGQFVCWDMPDGFTYQYDPVVEKLFRVNKNDENNAD